MPKFADFVLGELTNAITDAATTIRVTHASPYNAFPDPAGETARAVISDSLRAPTVFEVVTYTGVTVVDANTTDLTGVTRGADGTAAEAFDAGAAIRQDVLAANMGLLALQDDGVPVYAGGADSNLRKIAHGGNVARVTTTPDDTILAMDTLPDGTTYLVTRDGYVQKYDPDGVLEWEYYLRDSMSKLDDPSTLPASGAYSVAFSSNDSYLAVGGAGSPCLTIYKRSGDAFTKLPDPNTLPNGQGDSLDFSSDDTYLALGASGAPYLVIYKRDGDTFTKLPDPSTLPPEDGNDVAFSSSGTYLAVAHLQPPYITIYKRSGDTFTKLPDPDTLPVQSGLADYEADGVSFSPDENYLAVAHDDEPFVTIYKRSGDTFTKLPDPDTLPGGVGAGVSFSSNGSYLAVAHNDPPCIAIYKRSGDTFTKLPEPDVAPSATNGRTVSFSSDDRYLAISLDISPYLTIYRKTGDEFTKLPDRDVVSAISSFGATFSSNNMFLAVAVAADPYVVIYKRDRIDHASVSSEHDKAIVCASDDRSQVSEIGDDGVRDWLAYKDQGPGFVSVDEVGRIFFSGSSQLERLVGDGSTLWLVDGLNASVRGLAAGDVVAVADNNRIIRYDESGNELGSFSVLTGAKALQLDGAGNVYFIRADSSVVKSSLTGTVAWENTGITGPIYDLALDHDGNVFYAAGRRVGKLDGSDGSLIWEEQVADAPIYAISCPDLADALVLAEGTKPHLGRLSHSDLPGAPSIWEGAMFPALIDPETPGEGNAHLWVDDAGAFKIKFDDGSEVTLASK